MKLLRPEVRKPLLVQGCIASAGFGVCLFVNIPGAMVLLGTAAVMLAVQAHVLGKRQQRLADMCDEIDEILRGVETVSFDAFEEGELGILSAELQKMTVRLREQNTALRSDKHFMKEALEDMSHQLRTPLTTMLLILGMMREPELSKQRRMECVQELCGLVARMQWMLETLLNLSRVEAGAVTFQPEQLQAAALVQAALDLISIPMELKGVALHTEIKGSPTFRGDRQYCTEALVNLLKNCMEHTPEGGGITVQVWENPLYTGILIRDTGEGIPEEDLPHIFERFYRGSSFAKTGYGIGLAFARKIITAQNGSLQVRNAVPHGAEFEIRMYHTETI